VFLMGLVAQPREAVGPPLLWDGDASIAICEIVLAGAALALRDADGATRDELRTFLRRVPTIAGDEDIGGARAVAQTISGLVLTHQTLQYAIFGSGHRFDELEVEGLRQLLESILPDDTRSRRPTNRVLLRGLKAFTDHAKSSA
jgi:hypothetical protein